MKVQSLDLDFASLTPAQISELFLHQPNCLAAVASRLGFSRCEELVAYTKGRPRVISETPGLTLEEAINERASLHGMPPLGTRMTSKYGIEWEVVDYDFVPAPSTFARYANDCDWLPVVFPRKISERLASFIQETDRCTSKRILFFDTMPAAHPFKLGEDIHCANYSSNPETSYICLDAARAHETTFAHELAHLWLIYVQGGDDCRTLRDRSHNGRVNQLDFLQSFVLDLKANDLIAERGFDMSLINHDEIDGLTELRDAFVLGYQPPTPREALLHSLSIAGANFEQKRWPDEMKHRLHSLLDFFEAATPEIYRTAQELVEIVQHHGYASRQAIRKVLDECITLGFRATGDEFDLERDLQGTHLNECLQDKHPEELVGCPVPLKLEVGKTMARNGISGVCKIWIEASACGMAQIIVEDATGVKIGPLAVNYQLIPHPMTLNHSHSQQPQLVNGQIPDSFGRLPGDPAYNTIYPPGKDPFSQMAKIANGKAPDAFGNIPGQPYYNTGFAPGHMSVDQWSGNPIEPGFPNHGAVHRRPIQPNPLPPAFDPLNSEHPQQRRNPMMSEPPNTGLTRRYMAGLGRSVARTRLAQQQAMRGISGNNLYEYAYNNPVSYVDDTGNAPVSSDQASRKGGSNLICFPVTKTGGRQVSKQLNPTGFTKCLRAHANEINPNKCLAACAAKLKSLLGSSAEADKFWLGYGTELIDCIKPTAPAIIACALEKLAEDLGKECLTAAFNGAAGPVVNECFWANLEDCDPYGGL